MCSYYDALNGMRSSPTHTKLDALLTALALVKSTSSIAAELNATLRALHHSQGFNAI